MTSSTWPAPCSATRHRFATSAFSAPRQHARRPLPLVRTRTPTSSPRRRHSCSRSSTTHALVDGNKRLGWLATAVFLELNGVKASRTSNDDVYELVMWTAASNPDLDEITTRLRQVVQPSRRRK